MGMRKRRFPAGRIALATSLLMVTCCQTPQPGPQPTRQPPPRPVATTPPAPQPVPIPPEKDWIDRAQTPGDWSYRQEGNRSFATFASDSAPRFGMTCQPGGRIALVVPGTGGPEVRVRTETVQRMLTGTQQGGSLVVELPANDPLLDAMAITRGRFAIEAVGVPGLYLPAWAEVTRVIEDCR